MTKEQSIIDRAIEAINTTAIVKDIAGDQHGVVSDKPFHVVVNPAEIARAVLRAIREPDEVMVLATVTNVGDPPEEAWRIADSMVEKLTGPHAAGEMVCAEVVRDYMSMIDAALGEE